MRGMQVEGSQRSFLSSGSGQVTGQLWPEGGGQGISRRGS